MDNGLKLFVWEDVLTDYTSGMMVALAHDVDEARALLKKELEEWHYKEIDLEPTHVAENPAAFYVYGGG